MGLPDSRNDLTQPSAPPISTAGRSELDFEITAEIMDSAGSAVGGGKVGVAGC